MNTFDQLNEAQQRIQKLLWQDYTEGRQGHGRINSGEYRGYRALMEKQRGLFLVDIGRGAFDTYLSYADVKALLNVGVSRERTVKLHPAQIGNENTTKTLEQLKKLYEIREATDAEGKSLQSSSALRIQMLRGPLRADGRGAMESELANVEEGAGNVAEVPEQE